MGILHYKQAKLPKHLQNSVYDFQLFLLHIDEIISSLSGKEPHGGRLGSTSIICDQETKVRITVLLCTIVSRTNSLMGFKGINLRNTYRNIVNLKT